MKREESEIPNLFSYLEEDCMLLTESGFSQDWRFELIRIPKIELQNRPFQKQEKIILIELKFEQVFLRERLHFLVIFLQIQVFVVVDFIDCRLVIQNLVKLRCTQVSYLRRVICQLFSFQ